MTTKARITLAFCLAIVWVATAVTFSVMDGSYLHAFAASLIAAGVLQTALHVSRVDD